MLKGVDVGKSQGNIDWGKVAASGVAFAWVKCTEGEDWIDPTFTRARVAAIRKAKLIWGPYHYLRPRRDRNGAVEARHAVRIAVQMGWRVGKRGTWRGRDMPMCVDVERGTNEVEFAAMTGAQAREYVSDFCDEVKRLTGRGCVTYLSPGFAAEIASKAPRNGGSVWVAEWDAPDGKPHVPAGFARRSVLFHQTSDRGMVPGVPAPVDLDVFIGSRLRLQTLVAGVTVPNPAPKPPVVAVPPKMGTREVQSALRSIGWPIKVDDVRGPQTIQAIKDFQRGYALKTLHVDGLVGPATATAVRWSREHGGRCSEHFAFKEFADHVTHWIKVHRALVRGLEVARARLGGKPMNSFSAYRDPSRKVGAANSQHHYGNAWDPKPWWTVSWQTVASWKVFSGIGVDPHGNVRHVDVRHVGPNFTPGKTPANPEHFIDNF